MVFRLLVCAVALACLATPCSGAEIVRVGYIPVGDCLQLYVAEEQGYFAEEGILVENTPLKGGALIAMAVESGELDVGWSNTASLAVAKDRGFDFAILAPGAFELEQGRRVHSLLVAKDSPICSLADLQGKVVGINNFGNINEIAVKALLAGSGVDIQHTQFVEVPFPQMEAALGGGSVDAVLALEPFVTIAMAHGTAQMLELAAFKSFGPRMLIAAWFSTSKWIAENSTATEGFRRAVLKASVFIENNPEIARDVLTRHTKLTSDLAQKITLPYFAPAIEDADMQSIIDHAARFGFIEKAFPAKQLFGNGLR